MIENLYTLSQHFADADQQAKRRIVAEALVDPDITAFVDQHKDGWVGITGNFARVLACVLPLI